MTKAALSGRLVGLWLMLAILLQAVILAVDTPMSRMQFAQYFLVVASVMLLVAYLWRSRFYLNSHIDMLLIMGASGGFGMLLDMGIPGFSHHMVHAHAAVSWRMCLWMFLFGLLPAIPYSRCLQNARRGSYLVQALLIDSSAMIVGMWIAGPWTVGHVATGQGSWFMVGRHLTMLAGMMLGMVVGMWIRSTIFRKSGALKSGQTKPPAG